MNYIHAFDPGQTTGYALLAYNDPKEPPKLIDLRETFGNKFIHEWAKDFETRPGVVVIEDFRLYAGAAEHLIHNKFPAVITIGALQYVCWEHNVEPHYQMASMKGAFQDLVKHWDAGRFAGPIPTSRHVCDALRHGLAYYYGHVSTAIRR